jgi:hypothetical protein
MWLLDRFPNIRYYVDLHSYGETILHSWGNDDNQFDDPRHVLPEQGLRRQAGQDQRRGYREFIPASDEEEAIRMGDTWRRPSNWSGAGSTR